MIQHTSGKTRSRSLRRFFTAALAVCTVAASAAAADSLVVRIEDYFSSMKDELDKVAEARTIKGTSLRRMDRYFVGVLKRHQTIYSLIRTNSKGVVISEVIRGQVPERDYRRISNQRWFHIVERTREDYFGFLKEDDRYYLFWAKPVLKSGRSGKRFVGTVAAKIDLWDSFHAISHDAEKPFVVRVGNMSLYSHKWKKDIDYDQVSLDVAGVDNISVRFEKPVMHVKKDSVAAPMPAAAPVAGKPVGGPGKGLSFKDMNAFTKVVLGLMGVALLILIYFLVRLWLRFKDWQLRRRIEKEENMFA
jgi:hypothetical protein